MTRIKLIKRFHLKNCFCCNGISLFKPMIMCYSLRLHKPNDNHLVFFLIWRALMFKLPCFISISSLLHASWSGITLRRSLTTLFYICQVSPSQLVKNIQTNHIQRKSASIELRLFQRYIKSNGNVDNNRQRDNEECCIEITIKLVSVYNRDSSFYWR